MIIKSVDSTKRDAPSSMRGILALLLVLSLTTAACQAENKLQPKPTALTAALMGTWQVTQVHTDQGESHWSRTREDKYNIHKYLGRVFTINPQALTTNAPEDKRCDEPRAITHRTTAGKLFATSIASRPFDSVRPTAKDFQLPLSDGATVEVISLQCKEGPYAKGLGGGLEPNTGIDGVWLMALSTEQLALRWHDETILILRPLTEGTKPVASFNCAKASTVAEKAICGSVALALYDQSVGNTYKQAIEYYQSRNSATEQLTELKKTQTQWLAQRDNCKADSACLEKAMGDRVVEIEDGIAAYAYENRR